MKTASMHAFLRGRRFPAILAGICILAFVLRLGVCLQLRDLPSVRDPAKTTDMATYRDIGLAIRDGKLPDHFYYQPFYYSVFLPAVYLVTGRGVGGVLFVQSLLGAATVWLTGLAAARMFGRRAGIAAAVLLALARYHIFYTPFHLIAVLQSFWMALIAYLALRMRPERGIRAVVPPALAATAGILTRGNVLLIVPLILGLAAYRLRRTPRRLGPAVILFAAILYAPQLPFALRNLSYYGRWTGPSSAQDAVLALGNTPESPPGGLEYPETYRYWMSLADRPGGDRIPVSRQMLRFALSRPLVYAELKWRMFLLFWHRTEIPNNVSMAVEGRRSSILRFPLLTGFGLIGTLGVCGMLLTVRGRSPNRLFATGTILMYCAGTVLFYILARFRVPIVPLLCVFAGAGSDRLLRRLTIPRLRENRNAVALTLLGLAVSVFLVVNGYTFYRDSFEARVMRWIRPNGVFVATDKTILLYDHGPEGFGGLTLSTVPPGGLKVSKSFVLPPETAGERASWTNPRLRIAMGIGKDTAFSAGVSRLEPGPRETHTIERDALGVRWLVIPLKPFAISPDGVIPVTVSLAATKGDLAIGIDMLRDYGRSLYETDDGRTIDGPEAAMQLVWDPPPVSGS